MRLFFFFICRVVFRAESYTRECLAIDECAAWLVTIAGCGRRLIGGRDGKISSVRNSLPAGESSPRVSAPTFPLLSHFSRLLRRRKSRLRSFRDAITKSADMITASPRECIPRMLHGFTRLRLPSIRDSITRSLFPRATRSRRSIGTNRRSAEFSGV